MQPNAFGQARKPVIEDASAMTEGQLVHVDLLSNDPAASKEFYRVAFRWKFPPAPFGDYALWEAPAPPHGGLRKFEAHERPGTIAYLAVDSTEEARQRVVKAGGRVLTEDQEIPGFGRFFLFEAPGGIVQGAFEEKRPHD
jgi:predicted enzyme related to lactoylglutathione lyase